MHLVQFAPWVLLNCWELLVPAHEVEAIAWDDLGLLGGWTNKGFVNQPETLQNHEQIHEQVTQNYHTFPMNHAVQFRPL